MKIPADFGSIYQSPDDWTTSHNKELKHIMDQLNHRPQKSLGFKAPYELFFKKKTLLTVAIAS
jgi:IS30 family transposase